MVRFPFAVGPATRQHIMVEAQGGESYSLHGGQEAKDRERGRGPNIPFKLGSPRT